MRLVCPKCKANYEIPRHAVPIGGREVKCDSCGHSWFQTRTKTSNDEQLIEPQTEITKEDTEEVASAASDQKKIDEISNASKNLVDEAMITITPYLVGGDAATTLVDGDGFSTVAKSTKII